MSHIFISYSRKNLEIASKIVSELSKNELDIWIDWKNIPKSLEFDKEIFKGIEEADAFIFLISPDSIHSEVCNQEIVHAQKNNKRIITILIRDIDTKTLPSTIAKINWIDCRDSVSFENAINETSKAIHTDYDWLKFHTQLQLKALEWEKENDGSLLLHGKELEKTEHFFNRHNFNKDPESTKIQHQYVLASRTADNELKEKNRKTRNRNILLFIAATLSVVVAIWFGSRYGGALIGQQEAIAQSSQIAATNVVNQQSSIANNLAAQAQSLAPLGGQKSMIAVLLAIKSMQISPSQEATQIIQNNPYGHMLFETNLGEESIRSLAFSPDGRYLMASTDNETRIVDITNQKDIANLEGGHAVVSQNWKYVATINVDVGLCIWAIGDFEKMICVRHNPIINETDSEVIFTAAFSNNGDYVVTGGERTARVWDSSTGQEISHITHDNSVGTVAFSPDGKYVISGSLDGTARVWESATGREVSRMTHSEFVNCVAFSPDGRYVVSGGTGGVAIVWNPMNGSQITRVNHEGDVSYLTFTTDSEYVISSDFYTSQVWDAETGEKIAQTGSYANNGLEGIPTKGSDGVYVILDNSRNGDNAGIIWEAKTGREIKHILHNGGGSISTGAISPDRKLIVTGSTNGTVRIWNLEGSSNEVFRFDHYNSVNDVAFSFDGTYLATAGEDGSAHLWEIKSKTEIATMNGVGGNIRGGISSVLFSRDGKHLAFLDFGNTIQVWEIASNTKVAQMRINDDSVFVHDFAFSPDGKTIAYAVAYERSKGSVRLWEFEADTEVTQFDYDEGIDDIVFSPNGKFIAAGSGVNVYVTEISTKNIVFETPYLDGVNSIDFSPDSALLVIGGDPMSVWDFASDKEIARMIVDSSQPSTTLVRFNSDGSKILSKGSDGIIRIWETMTGIEIYQMNLDNVTTATFSPDDKYIATGGPGSAAHIWIWQDEDQLVTPCYYVTRNLTKEEWKRYIGIELPFEAICPDLPVEP